MDGRIAGGCGVLAADERWAQTRVQNLWLSQSDVTAIPPQLYMLLMNPSMFTSRRYSHSQVQVPPSYQSKQHPWMRVEGQILR
jgi:hypothetical protein